VVAQSTSALVAKNGNEAENAQSTSALVAKNGNEAEISRGPTL